MRVHDYYNEHVSSVLELQKRTEEMCGWYLGWVTY